MGTWDCIDGGLNERWTYIPLGITAEIQRVLQTLDATWPAPAADTTAWSSLISGPSAVRQAQLYVVQTKVVEPVTLPVDVAL